MFSGFEPIYDENSKVLILGSFPSVKSRENGFYYGNPQNRFWKMLAQIFGEKFENDIESKKAFLKKHKLALYDVVLQSDLLGSADLSLEKSTRNLADISSLLPPHTKVEKILCNGKTAFKLLTENNSNVIFEKEKAFIRISYFDDIAFEEKILKTRKINFEKFQHFQKKENKISKNAQKIAKNAKIPIFCLPSTSSANPRFDISVWQSILTK